MNQTSNYNFNVPIGSDAVNPLVQDFPNWTNLDTILRNVANTGITTATHTKTGTIHTLTFSETTVPMIRFLATADFNTNDTFTVNGLSVSALTVAGESLPDRAFVIGSMVLCVLRDNLLTVYSSGSDASTLEGHPASYFATDSDLQIVDGKANANKTLIDGINGNLAPNIGTFSHSWASASGDITRQNVIIPKGGLYLVNLTAKVHSGASGQFSFFVDNVANKVYSNAGTTILGTIGAALQNCTSSFSVVVDTRGEVNDYSLVVALWSAGVFTVGVEGNYVKIPTN